MSATDKLLLGDWQLINFTTTIINLVIVSQHMFEALGI